MLVDKSRVSWLQKPLCNTRYSTKHSHLQPLTELMHTIKAILVLEDPTTYFHYHESSPSHLQLGCGAPTPESGKCCLRNVQVDCAGVMTQTGILSTWGIARNNELRHDHIELLYIYLYIPS